MLTFSSSPWPRIRIAWMFAAILVVATLGLFSTDASAQSETSEDNTGACLLTNHVYKCDGAVFQKALTAATTVTIATHNADGVARSQLTNLITKKLGKTVVAEGSPADLTFLMIPIEPEGVVNGGLRTDLGTLRIYSVTSSGTRGPLLWAEDYSGDQDMPWPAVVRGLILQFQSNFHIK